MTGTGTPTGPRRALARRCLPVLTAAAVLLAAGCGSLTGPAEPARPVPTGPEVTLAFAGDVHFMRRTAELLKDPDKAFGPIAEVLSSSDVTLLNLETPITTRGTAEQKNYLFRTDKRAVRALLAAGVDAVSLANNHTLDYGRVGLSDTLVYARRGKLPVFGAGKNAAQAFAPWRTTVRGLRIAVFGFSQVDDLAEPWAAKDDRSGIAMAFDEDRALKAVSAARADSDLIIVMPHWGTEYQICADDRQKRFAARLAEAGADVIVGAHAHVLQGAGWLGRAYVAYGLGNFLWYSPGLGASSRNTGVLKLTVRKDTVVKQELVPAIVSGTGQPVPLTGKLAEAERRRFDALRPCSDLSAEPAG
ncbi:CapA family protein [Sphaerisporangium sp. TRM90804]|uniref:CapA family protein n=1 Tax=Sphaerisporangium sp. TRM90804 TaxID=3031113 RepID=UPI00244C1FA6|nr:CapA family protein [Sphaerisporangium sp. TRM90804]MDH2426675.1 CapA family protein [Sphaerisporangium sp. TRM90804]